MQEIVVASVVEKLSNVNGKITSKFLFPLLLHELSTDETNSFLKLHCSFYENKVLQLMSAWLSLERFHESTLFSLTEDRANTVIKTNEL